MRRWGIAITLGAGLLWPGAAQAATPKCGGIVTADTTLTRALRCPNYGLNVGQGVTLDLGGHTVYGSGTGSGIFLQAGATVRNGRVLGFETGVSHGNGDGTIEDMTIAHNGIGITAVSGLNAGARIYVRRSLVTANAGDGMQSSAASVHVSDSRFLRNGDYGVRAYSGDGSRFERSAFTANRRLGLYVNRGTSVIADNSASRNGLDGIVVEDSIDHYFFYSLANNQANYNRRVGIWFRGTPLDPLTGNNIDGGGNRATGNRDPRQCVLVACTLR